MGEHPATIPDITDIRWNTGPGAEAATEPTEGQKDTGYAYEDPVPYDEENWRLGKYYAMLDWLLDQVPREFTTVKEGLDNVAELDSFRVRQTVSNASPRGAHKVFTNTQGQGGAVAISCMCTDGRRIYYAQGANVYAADPETGTLIWSHTTNSLTVTCLCADGYHVYVGRQTGTGYEVEALDPTDGSVDAGADMAANAVAIASNGVKLAVVVGNDLAVYTIGASSLSYDGAYTSHGAALAAVAVDDVYAYIGGTQGTGSFDLRAIRLSDRTAQWSVALPTTAAATINGIACDGEVVYVVTDSVTTSGGSASLFAQAPTDGSALWDGYGSLNHDRVYVDDRYIVIVRDNGDTRMVCKRDRHVVRYIGSGTMERCWGLDPLGAIVTNGSYDFNRIYLGYQTRLCQKTTVTDIKRRPYHAAAVPLAGG